MDSPIIPMIKRALVTPDDHSLQAIKLSDCLEPMKTIANVTTDFWREGIPVTYWKFLPLRRSAFRQIWLPPYQFQPTGHWLKNVDRAIEAEKNATVERTIIVEKPQEPKAALKLVNVGKGVGKYDRSREFDIFLGIQRFIKIVSGHAVRQRPLCPASMYMECAAMGLQLLQGDIGAGSLGFRDLAFQAALGVDLARVASLTLEKADDSQAWDFVIKSSSKADPKSRSSTHAKGKTVLTPELDFRTYERLIACSIKELESKPNTEKLMCNRAYGLFSQVVHYAEFLQGISHITMGGTEARADIDFSADAQFGLEESTVMQYCDTVTIDTFIQVVGLLIISSTLMTSEDVYVATGVDHVSMSSACDFNRHKSWTVYTEYTTTGEGQAAGDIFVMTRDGTLAMIITGAQFTKLLISKLERFLDSANAKPSQVTAIGNKNLPQVTEPKSSETTSSATSVGSATPSAMNNSSSRATSVESTDRLPTGEGDSDDAEMSFRNIIVTYTGISAAEIAHDANIGDLGVDSLAAVELAEELQAQFGKEVEAEDLLMKTFGALAELLVPVASAKKAKLPTQKKSGPQAAIPTQTPSPFSPSSNVNAGPQDTKGHQTALKLLSETSGAPIHSIEGKATLQELGIDFRSPLLS